MSSGPLPEASSTSTHIEHLAAAVTVERTHGEETARNPRLKRYGCKKRQQVTEQILALVSVPEVPARRWGGERGWCAPGTARAPLAPPPQRWGVRHGAACRDEHGDEHGDKHGDEHGMSTGTGRQRLHSGLASKPDYEFI